MIDVEPEQRARKQKTANLASAVIEDGALPIRMEALPRIGVFVKVGSVEVGQPVLVVGEMRRDPVQNDADIVLVQVVHQIHKILRSAIAARGSEVRGGLVPPRPIERALRDRQKLQLTQ